MNFDYKDTEKDIERWLEKHGTKEVLPSGQICIRGYDAAKEFVIDAYFKEQAHDALVAFALKGYRDQAFIDRLTAALLHAKDSRRLKRLWQAFISAGKLSYWQSLSVDRFFDTEENGIPLAKEEVAKRHKEQTLPRLKNEVLETMRQFEAILIELGEQESTLTRLRDDIQLFESGEKRKVTSAPQKRTIDENVFWEIIGELQTCDSTEEKCTQLVIVLESFSAADIKRFEKILTAKLDQANHFDIWALAYLAQGGCSDDAFEGFRAWLILQGKSLFDLTIKDVNEACALIPAGLETEAEQFAGCAAIAFENRSGLPLAVKVTKTKTKGKQWQEEKLESLYPKLWKRYIQEEGNHQPLL